MTKSQKANVAKKTKEYKHLLDHPEKFIVRIVSKNTKALIKRQGGDIKTVKNKVIIPLGNFTSAKVSKGKIIYDSPNRTESAFLVKPENILDQLEMLGNKKLKKNQLITARIGSSGGFLRSRYNSYQQLYLYITEFFGADMTEAKRDKLILQMTLVEVKLHAKKKNK